ncbi:MAG TPA: hypothetical protein VGJ29_10210 [Vicinamibacterales bacterium]
MTPIPVNQFPNARAAKEFVVEQIVAEAKRQGVLLSDVERKMLYFSETDWTLPDIVEVAAHVSAPHIKGRLRGRMQPTV